ncbi:MAG: hypothetical protein HKO65_00750 [Gemmatimonadetes bacterium]|nr:hypothetical protein [Gemmatimonadota bacterium]NNM03600.1 hypothetical protein [Gemmatimonadota bacterium]
MPKTKKTLEAYYAGKRLESPQGGHLDILGIREGSTGLGRVLMECNTSSLRFVLRIPKATKTEKADIKKLIEAGEDLFCPRHGDDQRLTKSGKNWICALCGISYGKS